MGLLNTLQLWSARSSKIFGMYADTLARQSEKFSLDLRLHLTRGFDAPAEASAACFAGHGEAATEAERRIYRVVQLDYTDEIEIFHMLFDRFNTGRMGWMAHRKWKETKQLPCTAGPGNMLGCCLISFHFM